MPVSLSPRGEDHRRDDHYQHSTTRVVTHPRRRQSPTGRPTRCAAPTTTSSSPSSIAPARPRSRRAIAGAVRGVRDDAAAARLAPRRDPEAIADAIDARRDDFARTIALEAGKPIKTARVEADRAAFTFSVAAEESKRIYGEFVPLDWLPGNEGRTAQVRRVPLGPIAGITPFNFPLNLVAHKVAPALAAGNPIVLRPACQTPISSLKLAQIVLEAGWPEDAIAVVPSTTDDAAPLVEDDRLKLLTFTGSPEVGWGLKRAPAGSASRSSSVATRP